MKIEEFLDEKLVVFGKKTYPKFNNIIILAGGASSGKGFVLSNLLGIEGKVFDVDELKKLVLSSNKLANDLYKKFGIKVKDLNLKNPDHVSKIHDIVSTINLPDKNQKAVFNSIVTADPKRKPNLIFDVTLKGITKLYNISRQVEELGYDKKNVHIVWIINDIEVAEQQNLSRDRTVPYEILMDTHKGAALTMKEIIDGGNMVRNYADGDIWLVFNKVGVDSNLEKSEPKSDKTVIGTKDKGGSYIKDAFYIKVKSVGKEPVSSDKLEKEVYDKIKSYVPDVKSW